MVNFSFSHVEDTNLDLQLHLLGNYTLLINFNCTEALTVDNILNVLTYIFC